MKTLSRPIIRQILGALGLTLPLLANAQLTCASLPSQPPLAGNPAVFAVTATQMTQSSSGRAYCRVNVTWRDPAMVGAQAGYAPGGPPTVDTFQSIRMSIVLPLNTNVGDAGWGGRLFMVAAGQTQGSTNPGSQLGSLDSTIAMNPAAVAAISDSGHGDSASGSGNNWAVIQGVGLNMGKITDWTGGRSNYITVRLAKQLAQAYYGRLPQRTYWAGQSGAGHMGLAQMMNHPEEYDGALIGAPANHWQKFQLAVSHDNVVRKKVAQLTTPLTSGQVNAADSAAVAACDAQDGVVDGILADPRTCTWSATNNICGVAGAPAAPNCVNPIQAAGLDRIWDGARNSYGHRIWHPKDRGVSLGASTETEGGTARVFHFAFADTSLDGSNLYEDQESIDLAAAAGVNVSTALTYEKAAELVSRNGAEFIDVDQAHRLEKARALGKKIIVYHGATDNQIQWRNALDFYVKAALHFGDGNPHFHSLSSWFRFFVVPGVGHTSQPYLPDLINWVENGIAPDRIDRTTGRFPVVCPFPKKALFTDVPGASITDPANYTCGGNMQTPELICAGLRVPDTMETSDVLQTYGRHTPGMCATKKGPK
jgi:hypothetical protein